MNESTEPEWFGRVFLTVAGGFVGAIGLSMAFTQFTGHYFHPGSKSNYVYSRTENVLEVIVIVAGVIAGCAVGALIPAILSWLDRRRQL